MHTTGITTLLQSGNAKAVWWVNRKCLTVFMDALTPITAIMSNRNTLAGVVGCWHGYQSGADLYMAQLMPLPLTISCYSKSRLVLLSGASSHR